VWIVVGLGNPGKEYSETRHNVGFMVVKRAAHRRDAELKGKRYHSKSADVGMGEDRVFLAIPQTYMNRSGQAVREILNAKNAAPEKLVIVFDDLDIPLGEIRVRKHGSAGTHKGMISVVQETGTINFPRIRVGIGPLPPDRDAADYVLSPFARAERPHLQEGLEKAEDALDLILTGRIEQAMNIYNRKASPPAGGEEAGKEG